MELRDLYPIGQQSFETLRNRGAIYVDKTKFLWDIVMSQSQYYFLGRPRRFGKSLFLDTIKCFFEGKRELFKGLYIDSKPWEWEKWPVFKFDLNTERYDDIAAFDDMLSKHLSEWEKTYNVTAINNSFSQRFSIIVKAAHEVTGKQVVILVDEYDKPLVSNLNCERDDVYEYYRSKLASLYSNFKSSAEHIRFVFLTGVSRFSKLSIFSDLNNINDITFDNDFADICGISEEELHNNFRTGIIEMASTYDISYEEMSKRLKDNYDGYKFAAKGSDMYNPWSVLNALSKREVSDYWTYSGLPTLIAEMLKRIDANLEEVFDSYCSSNDLRGFDLASPNPQSLLYQTGYITIKGYDRELDLYHLGIPNAEVRRGLFQVLLPYYADTKGGATEGSVKKMVMNFKLGRPEEAMKELQSFFAGVAYKLKMENENNFHNSFYLLTELLGLETQAEVMTSEGRIDMVIKTPRNIYLLELKYDDSAENALAQIEEKKYARPYQTDDRKLFKIGVNFSSASRCIEDWIIK